MKEIKLQRDKTGNKMHSKRDLSSSCVGRRKNVQCQYLVLIVPYLGQSSTDTNKDAILNPQKQHSWSEPYRDNMEDG